MKTGVSTALRNHNAGGSPTLATCWKATLTNETVVTATSLDRNIEYPIGSGVIYLATAAYTPSDIESASDLSPDNLELEGFLASPHITAVDLHSGVWDFAAIEIFEVNYKDLTMGRNRLREGKLGEVKGRSGKFTAELRGLTQAYSRQIVRLMMKTCSWDLGSTEPRKVCGVNLAPFTFTSTVEAVSANRTITDAARTEENDWFTGGLVSFITGLNAGLSMEVKSSIPGSFTLAEAMPFAIEAGDVYELVAGCDKSLDTCKDKFDNVLNFGGFPHIPGSKAYAGPTRE